MKPSSPRNILFELALELYSITSHYRVTVLLPKIPCSTVAEFRALVSTNSILLTVLPLTFKVRLLLQVV